MGELSEAAQRVYEQINILLDSQDVPKDEYGTLLDMVGSDIEAREDALRAEEGE